VQGSPVPAAEAPPQRRRRARRIGSACVLGAAYGAWQGSVGRDTVASRVGVAAAVAGALVLGLATIRRTQPAGRPFAPGIRGRPAVAGWAVLLGATTGWDLWCLVRQSASLPTLSRLCGDVTGHGWGRGALFAAWLGLGVALCRGQRARRSGGTP
jgi:hypothetical protein